MTILFKLDAQGGFTCGDTETGRTCYAYPTSPNANGAKKHPERVAKMMMKYENKWSRRCTRTDVVRMDELQAIAKVG